VTNVTNREVDGVSVVTPYGCIVFGEGSNAVREKVKSLIGEADCPGYEKHRLHRQLEQKNDEMRIPAGPVRVPATDSISLIV